MAFRKPNHQALAVGLIIALAVVFFAPALVKSGSAIVGSPKGDGPHMFYPHRVFASGEILRGSLPLWNPFVFCGHPFHAEGQGAILYPLNLALVFFSPTLAYNLSALLHFAGMGVFFFLYLRAIKLSLTASLFGALVYLFSSGPISRLYAGHQTIWPCLMIVPAMVSRACSSSA